MKEMMLCCGFLYAMPLLALEEAANEIHGFLAGDYQIIGKRYESSETYLGEGSITMDGDSLAIVRSIAGADVVGAGGVRRAEVGDIRKLQWRFADRGLLFEATCLYRSDFNNYARITCHYYRPGVATDDPGMEAWFIDHEKDGGKEIEIR